MDKEENAPWLVEDKVVMVSHRFIPEEPSGTVDVEITIPGANLDGVSLVVFESLLHDDIEVALHADIEDEGQTVSYAYPDLPLPPTGRRRAGKARRARGRRARADARRPSLSPRSNGRREPYGDLFGRPARRRRRRRCLRRLPQAPLRTLPGAAPLTLPPPGPLACEGAGPCVDGLQLLEALHDLDACPFVGVHGRLDAAGDIEVADLLGEKCCHRHFVGGIHDGGSVPATSPA